MMVNEPIRLRSRTPVVRKRPKKRVEIQSDLQNNSVAVLLFFILIGSVLAMILFGR